MLILSWNLQPLKKEHAQKKKPSKSIIPEGQGKRIKVLLSLSSRAVSDGKVPVTLHVLKW